MTGPNPFGGELEARPSGRPGMFGVTGSGDTSGYGGLVRRPPALPSTPRPYGGWFDDLADQLERAFSDVGDAIERVIVDRGELTLHVVPGRIADVCRLLRDDPLTRFELLSSLSGVHYPADVGRELHVVYHLTSMTHGGRRVRLEVSVPDVDRHLPSVVAVYPTADFQERETWDMFGVIFDGHPALTRILMPDDWPGHPQRKDYPLGGVPVEYKGAQIPPPDQRRAYA
ncbi:MAG TPA: NADH-quinone oxidoreductase subunit C [Mycobacteriales bacterium]|nr:NADH-quinone oxidoreductase subunit C [Mycobacteriales bacterium]